MKAVRVSVVGLVITLGLTMTGGAHSQSQDAAATVRRFGGTWRLVSWTQRLADGTRRQEPRTVGYLIYTDDHMCGVIVNPNRPKWKSETAPTPDEAKSGIEGLVAYCSTVEVHAKDGFVLHHVEVDRSPNVGGRIRKRWFTFEGPNRLTLRVDSAENAPPVVDSTLVWEREEANK